MPKHILLFHHSDLENKSKKLKRERNQEIKEKKKIREIERLKE